VTPTRPDRRRVHVGARRTLAAKAHVNRGHPALAMPSAAGIMTARTLANSHPSLLDLLSPGMSVLDVGCGPGTLTAEMAVLVAPGQVMGMDVNPEMIRLAEASVPSTGTPNLTFYTADIRTSEWSERFDLANAARVLQWLPDPVVAVRRMAKAVAPGALVVLLDYDHTRARWAGEPDAWARFFSAFLAWRAGAGLDNAITRQLPAVARSAGLGDVELRPQVTSVRAGEPDFFRVAGAWRMIAESRGRQMVAASYVTERQRRAALDALTDWMQGADASHTVHEVCVVARRPA